MSLLIAWVGFFGAWLLFAGPVFQAALELQEQEVDREKLSEAAHGVGPPAKVSNWWWLLPPVHYVFQQRSQRAYRIAVFRALGEEDLRNTVRFFDKANGWMLVAGGAFLIGVKETWELVEATEWPIWTFWVLIVLAPAASASYTISNIARDQDLIKNSTT